MLKKIKNKLRNCGGCKRRRQKLNKLIEKTKKLLLVDKK